MLRRTKDDEVGPDNQSQVGDVFKTLRCRGYRVLTDKTTVSSL